jgi:hypothetical protein
MEGDKGARVDMRRRLAFGIDRLSSSAVIVRVGRLNIEGGGLSFVICFLGIVLKIEVEADAGYVVAGCALAGGAG